MLLELGPDPGNDDMWMLQPKGEPQGIQHCTLSCQHSIPNIGEESLILDLPVLIRVALPEPARANVRLDVTFYKACKWTLHPATILGVDRRGTRQDDQAEVLTAQAPKADYLHAQHW